MSLTVIEAEVRRFLLDPSPEVLCITGKWGVGKTYGWRTYLRAAKENGALGLQRYAYVSLFGLNRLDDVRYAIFENTVSGKNIGRDPDAVTLGELIRDRDTGRKLKPIVEMAAAFFNRTALAELLAKSAFLTIREQLICLDDLERAGNGLNTRDILGLASLLKEERQCKVVLLLNDEKLDDKDEFKRQIEKVADISFRFDPTPDEAAAIAFADDPKMADLIRPRTLELGITNIRVMKKIERLAGRLVDLLQSYDAEIVSNGVTTLVLASWAVQQPGLAPSLEFLRNYNSIAFGLRAGKETLDSEAARCRSTIANYPFMYANDLDREIIDGAEVGYFREAAIKRAADQIVAERSKYSRDNDFARVWSELYHGSLATDDDGFLDALHASAIKDAAAITPLNINGAIHLLREFGRSNQAEQVIASYMAAHDDERFEFFDISSHHFSSDDKLDTELRDAFAARKESFADSRDPLAVLREIGERRGWDDSDVALLSKQTAEDFERMFEALRGEDMKSSIRMVRAIGQGQYAESDVIEKASLDALRRIAAKSPIRARKIQNLGIEIGPVPAPVGGASIDPAAGSHEDV